MPATVGVAAQMRKAQKRAFPAHLWIAPGITPAIVQPSILHTIASCL
jgi:hypothetical protein